MIFINMVDHVNCIEVESHRIIKISHEAVTAYIHHRHKLVKYFLLSEEPTLCLAHAN